MRLTQYTDYSLRVLMYLGLKGDKLATINEIADRYGISENHLMKVVHQLGREGFVHTVRGRNGGMRLAVAPKDINIGDVVRKCEDDLRIVECFDAKTSTCPISNVCGLAGLLDDALEAFLTTLDKKTLADILKASPMIAPVLQLADA
jgi:Rrf2 family nitric oxide-sensitive transcriptional repressor